MPCARRKNWVDENENFRLGLCDARQGHPKSGGDADSSVRGGSNGGCESGDGGDSDGGGGSDRGGGSGGDDVLILKRGGNLCASGVFAA